MILNDLMAQKEILLEELKIQKQQQENLLKEQEEQLAQP